MKNVVTVFLSHRRRILLVQRSDRVGSYRGRWAGISGYVEQNEEPLKRAVKEISEEVNLASDSVSLKKAGRPFPVLDEGLGTLWVVHPFLFATRNPHISLNWEHSAHRWIARKDLHKFETVPKLEEALDRVLDDYSMVGLLHPAVQAELAEIREDRVHGASELSRRSLRAMRLGAELTSATTPADLFRQLKVFGGELTSTHPNMAPLTNLVGKLLYLIAEKARKESDVDEFKLTVKKICDQLIEESVRASHEVALHGSKLIQDHMTIFTHSRSATVFETFKVAASMGRRIRVVVTESRPLFEGRAVAQELSGLGIRVNLVVDAAMGYMMDTADICVVGADSVLSDGSVVNKIGTFPLAMSANQHNKPFYVLCEKSKFNLRSVFEARRGMEERDEAEVLPDQHGPFLDVRNPYFDTTPGTLVSKLITEDGALSREQLPKLFLEILGETYL